MISRTYEIVSLTYEMISRSYEILTRPYNIVFSKSYVEDSKWYVRDDKSFVGDDKLFVRDTYILSYGFSCISFCIMVREPVSIRGLCLRTDTGRGPWYRDWYSRTHVMIFVSPNFFFFCVSSDVIRSYLSVSDFEVSLFQIPRSTRQVLTSISFIFCLILRYFLLESWEGSPGSRQFSQF